MPKIIKLHHYISAKDIWINTDAIISVVDERPAHEGTGVYTYAGDPLYYRVAETPETVVGMIEKACNPLNSYTFAVPDIIDWAKEEQNQLTSRHNHAFL